MRHLDLFSGIGGFSRAVEWLGGTTVAFVEWDSWNRRVLAKHWPDAQFFGDIHDVGADELSGLGRIDIITGGYPCQPFSQAGKRLGAEDDRHLWPEMRRIIRLAHPRFVLAENVAGHVTMGLDTVLADLEEDGYACGAVVVPACAVNALHRRNRVWIMAHATSREQGQRGREQWRHATTQRGGSMGHANGTGLEGRQQCLGSAGERATRTAGGEPSELADPESTGSPRRGIRDGLETGQSHATNGSETRRKAAVGQAPRSVDAGADGVPAGLVRRPTARSPWDDPDLIRAMWADGSWERDLPRVVAEEAERRQKLQAAGNAIVPLVAYEILAVMLGVAP